jgi:hypothetical protein
MELLCPFKSKRVPGHWRFLLTLLLATALAVAVPVLPAVAGSGYTLPPSTQLRAVAYGNGTYVMAGDYDDTSVTTSTGSVLFLTSPDGSTWTVQPAINNIEIVGIAFGSSLFVAVGRTPGKTHTSGVVLTSGDGVHWTQQNSFDVEFNSVVYGAGTFVLIGYNDNYTSTDGVNWTPISKQYAGALYEYFQLLYTGSVFADFNETQFASSPNGAVWQTADMGVIDWSKYLNIFPEVGVTGAVYGDNRYVAVGAYYSNTPGPGSYPIVITSPDGVKWTMTKLDVSCQLEKIAFGNGIFVATGLDGDILTSSSGLAWTVRDTGTKFAYGPVSFCNNEFVAMGDGGAIATSPDGVHWTNSSSAYQAVFAVGQSSYVLNGQTSSTDAAPFIEEGRVFVPVRYLGDALGVDVGWNGDPNDKTVQLNDNRIFTDKGGLQVTLTIGSRTIASQGSATIGALITKTMDVAPLIRNGRTYLPARYVAEAFGYTLAWDAAGRTVTIQ